MKFPLEVNIVLAASYILYAVNAQEYKNCTNNDAILSISCPENSKCNKLENSFHCICNEGFYLGPSWNESDSKTLRSPYCLNKNDLRSNSTPEENKLIIYIRSPAKKEHLAFGILMVLSAAIVAIIVIYVIQKLKKLSKKTYLKMKRRRQNHHPLQEFNYVMTGRDGNELLIE